MLLKCSFTKCKPFISQGISDGDILFTVFVHGFSLRKSIKSRPYSVGRKVGLGDLLKVQSTHAPYNVDDCAG